MGRPPPHPHPPAVLQCRRGSGEQRGHASVSPAPLRPAPARPLGGAAALRRTAPHRTARRGGPGGGGRRVFVRITGGGGGSAASASRFGGVGRLRLFPAPHGWAAGRSWPRGKELAITPSTVVGREVAPGARGRCGAGPAKRGGGVPPPSCGAFEG